MFSEPGIVQSGAPSHIDDWQLVNAGELQGLVAGLERSRIFVPESDHHVSSFLQPMRQSKTGTQIEWIGEEGGGRDWAGQSKAAGDERRPAFIGNICATFLQQILQRRSHRDAGGEVAMGSSNGVFRP